MLIRTFRRTLVAVAVLMASPFALAQTVAPVTPVPQQAPSTRPSPAERAALHAAHENVKKAHEAVKADVARLHADRAANATPAQIALDRGNLKADVQVFRGAREQWKQTLDAFFAAHPGARERWEQHHAQHGGPNAG